MRSTRLLIALVAVTAVAVVALLRTSGDRARTMKVQSVSEHAGSAPGPATETEPVSQDLSLPPDSPFPSPVDLERADRDLDLHGRVVDAEGAPVAGARIEALIPEENDLGFNDPWLTRQRHLERESRSASDGTFLFRLARGDLRDLRVSHPDFAETEVGSCAAGERIEVVLHAGARLVVTAIDPEGEPAAGLRVRLDYRAPGGVGGQRRGETDERGTVEIAGLHPGRARIKLVHERFSCSDMRDLVLLPGETVEISVLLRAGMTVSGAVRDRATGLPIAGATVIDGRISLSGRSTATDVDGRYTLIGVQFLELRAEAEGYGQARVILPDEIDGLIDFELPRGDTAVGALVDEAGGPIAGVSVSAVIPGAQTPFGETRRATTSEDGSFRIESLHPEGPHTLVVIEPGFARTQIDFDGRLRRPDGVIDLGTIVLRPGRRIEGVFVDEEGEPIPREGVSLFGHGDDRDRFLPGSDNLATSSDGSSESRRTDDRGRFRFDDLAVGEYRLSAGVDGWPGVREMVRIEEGGADPVFVQLVAPSGEVVELRLVTPEGDPVPAVRVSVKGRDQAGSASDTTDAEGIVRLGGVPGPLQVRLDLPRGYLHRRPFEIEPRGGSETIVVEREAIVSGILLAPDGTPLPRTYLDVIEREPTPGHEGGRIAQTQTDGTFEIRLSPGAEIDLDCSGVREEGGLRGPFTQVWTGFQGKLTGVVAPAEGLRFRLERVAIDQSLVVRVVDAGGSPVPGAQIVPSVGGSKAGLATAETDAEGIATLAGLPAMPLFLRCVPPEHPAGSAWSWLPPGSEVITPAGQEWLVRLQRGASLSGLVVDETGSAVDGAIVRATTSTQRHLAMQCDRGEFEFILLDGEIADLEAEVLRAKGGKVPRGALRGVAAGPEPVRIVVRPE